jgi:hypothetical protein
LYESWWIQIYIYVYKRQIKMAKYEEGNDTRWNDEYICDMYESWWMRYTCHELQMRFTCLDPQMRFTCLEPQMGYTCLEPQMRYLSSLAVIEVII